MTTPSKQSSRWGSFLQQAVAEVENRLDNILAEGGEESPAVQPVRRTVATVPPPTLESPVSRSASSGGRLNDRLQERLVRAVAAKSSAHKGDKWDSLAASPDVPSRAGSPVAAADSAPTSIDVVSSNTDYRNIDDGKPLHTRYSVKESRNESQAIVVQPDSLAILEMPDAKVENVLGENLNREALMISGKCTRFSGSNESIDSVVPLSLSMDLPGMDAIVAARTPADYDALVEKLQSEFEAVELQRREEMHDYVERIDALESKLRYLTKESAENARKAGAAAPSGSIEKRLADKEQQIALLMEEGQSLSKKELNHLNTIKKLRSKIQEEITRVAETKKMQADAQKDVAILTERWRKAQATEKQFIEMKKTVTQLHHEIEALRIENRTNILTIGDLQSQLEDAREREKQTGSQFVHKSVEAERKRVAELEEDIANLKIEKQLISDRAQSQVEELREKVEKDAERARVAESAMKTEQQILESKLEIMRAKAEEVSSGATGDAQAKLLRQIETLQTQYAVASENWQGIQASLASRATNLENERDEATRRESDIRRKARVVTLKCKHNEDQLEEAKAQMSISQQELIGLKYQLETMQKKAGEAEKALKDAHASFEQERQAWKLGTQQRLNEEKQKWNEETSTPGSVSYSGADSPVASSRRGLTSEYLGLQNLQIRRTSRPIANEPINALGLPNRRPSIQPPSCTSGNGTPTRNNSTTSFKDPLENGSIHTDPDDFFDNHRSPSPYQTINDMISVSATTAGAGPSVQLVERMSSAVRRLESEKVATKEDIVRLSAQRDEARAEIVHLLREVEAKRQVDRRVAELEKDLADIAGRYETTLLMLGEKSEEVDELRGDVADLKGMYRDLVERTVK